MSNPNWAKDAGGLSLKIGDVVTRVKGKRDLGTVVTLWLGLAGVVWEGTKRGYGGRAINGTKLRLVSRSEKP